MKRFIAALALAVTGCLSLLADDIAYVYDVSYNSGDVTVYVKMNTQAQKKYKSVRVKVEPIGTTKRLFANGVYKYVDIYANNVYSVTFKCKDDAAASCGIADYIVTTVDVIKKEN